MRVGTKRGSMMAPVKKWVGCGCGLWKWERGKGITDDPAIPTPIKPSIQSCFYVEIMGPTSPFLFHHCPSQVT